ncbi:GlgB N-terminal domain-containing protein, partial [Streptomyces thermoalcalitolerans]|uniref:GlgB N-terminal domain-containing protein n=1 Tax=Streptomyces thermoalcalitolerans TaxID=65605 RepID=UPI003CD09656
MTPHPPSSGSDPRKTPQAAAGAEPTPAPRKSAARKTTAAKTAVKKTAARRTAGKRAAGKAPAAPEPVAPVAPEPVAAPPAPSVPAGIDLVRVGAADRERLLGGTHHDPHSVLGAHPVPGGVAFRVLRPYALGVSVVIGTLRSELNDDGDGFFSGLLPLRDVPEYRLEVAYEGTVQHTADAYSFLPTLGEFDLHLIGEGRHEQLWKALGAEPMTHQGVT